MCARKRHNLFPTRARTPLVDLVQRYKVVYPGSLFVVSRIRHPTVNLSKMPRRHRRQRDEDDQQEAIEKNAKKQRKEIITKFANELIVCQSNSSTRKERYGQFTRKIREAQINMPWLTIDQVKSKANQI